MRWKNKYKTLKASLFPCSNDCHDQPSKKGEGLIARGAYYKKIIKRLKKLTESFYSMCHIPDTMKWADFISIIPHLITDKNKAD